MDADRSSNGIVRMLKNGNLFSSGISYSNQRNSRLIVQSVDYELKQLNSRHNGQ